MMDRRLIAGLLGLFVTGCALSQSSMPKMGRRDRSVESEGLPPIDDTINRTSPATDVATRRAEHVPPTDNAKPISGQTPSVPTVAPAGRPAPFADRGETSPRLQAPPASGRAEDQPAEPRPAPFAGRPPAVERPKAGPVSSTLPALSPLLPPRVLQTSEPDPVKVDTSVLPTAATVNSIRSPVQPNPTLAMGSQLAAVGNEVITDRQLKAAVKEMEQEIPPEQWKDPRVKYEATKMALDRIIKRTLVIQAVKKQVKDVKNLQTVYDGIDRDWINKELPPLLRQSNSANIHELKRKYAEMGKSLDTVREDYRYNTLAREFMLSKIQSKMTASLPEKQKYYMAHVKDFDRHAQVVWREIAVENSKCANRAEARRKIDAILIRLKKGEDFAKLAKAESHGVTAAKGGLWETTPGGFGLPEVNDAIAVLTPGQVSGVIEAPGGFHLVLVESKRDAGPARFDEVQDQIKELILQAKYARLSEEFINNLRRNTVVTTMFDDAEVDSSAVRTSTSGNQPR